MLGSMALMLNLLQYVTVINNVAPAHLETFGDVEGVAKAKGEIYQYLQANGTAVINVDDPFATYWMSLLKAQNIKTFGLEHTADITCQHIVEEHKQIKFELVTDIDNTKVILPLLGFHNVMNALAATAVARALDYSLEDIKAGKNGAKIIDDTYNANPRAMQFALHALTKQSGRKIMVIGDMVELGAESDNKHKELGQKIKAAGIDVLLAFGKQTRLAVDEFGEKAQFFSEKPPLIAALSTMLDADTVVLVKGAHSMKLHEVVNAVLVK